MDMDYAKTNKIYESLFKKDIATFCNKFPLLYMEALAMYHGVEYWEFKRTEDDNPNIMKEATKEALDQIFIKDYWMNFSAYVKEIVEVGIAFCDKVAFVLARCLKRMKIGKLLMNGKLERWNK
ncbi:hypothetical protein C1645_829469 [Glomus cerebriforme]|uniref:Uncharacterized protein n=1 Tax=Glomus cerebriforme TaxID=658196 RepID=A0A397SN34_9GLOM|nr:hypothetical protein C1645_829469 [Glomus cerebriforme]